MDTSLTATASPRAARSLHEICEAARRGTCGPFCGALELGHWDRQVARWLADLDVQTMASVIGWVSRAGREPAPGVIVRALADAIAYQTALTSGCPDCAEAAPEGCADHREDAARAAEYERALRSLVTGRDAQLWTPARSAGARCRLASAVPRISL